MSKNLTGESKEEYQKEKAVKEERKHAEEKAKADLKAMSIKANKEDLKDLTNLLKNSSFVDDNNNWLAGFPNFKTNQNAIVANLFSGKKNLRLLTQNNDVFYLLSINNDAMSPYKAFSKEDVIKVETGSKLLSKSIKLIFKNGDKYSVDVTENKDKIKYFKNLF